MSDEGGVEGDEETAPPGWRVRTGRKNKPTQKDREEHEATHVRFGGWCTRCTMGRGRTHHCVTVQQCEDQLRRPTITIDSFFMEMKCFVNAQRKSEESVTCIAVKEDRHQNIMSSVALKKGIEESWTIEGVANFIDLLGYREITLKSDTEQAIIAFRNRVAETCKAEVTTEDAANR